MAKRSSRRYASVNPTKPNSVPSNEEPSNHHHHVSDTLQHGTWMALIGHVRMPYSYT